MKPRGKVLLKSSNWPSNHSSQFFYSSLLLRIEHTKKKSKKAAHTKRGNFLIMKTDVEQEIIFSLSFSLHTTKVFSLPRQFFLSIFSSFARKIFFRFFLCEEVNADVVKRLVVMIFECGTIFSLWKCVECVKFKGLGLLEHMKWNNFVDFNLISCLLLVLFHFI